jgi:probable F420-dependent oxidoreductase
LKFGLRLPTFALGPKTDGIDKIIPYVQEAEKLGFESFFVIDHTLPTIPAYVCSWLEPISLLGCLVGVTKKSLLGPLVLVAPFRHPLLLAKTFATLDFLSSGRMVFAVGVGWTPAEFENYGVSLKDRGARTDEIIQVVKKLWTEDNVNFAGKYYTIKDVSLQPKPHSQPLPIWVGGGSLSLSAMLGKPPPNVSRVLRRVAREADVWVPQAVTLPEVVTNDWKQIRNFALDYGRDPESIRVAYSNFAYVLKPNENPVVAKPLFARYSGLRFEDQKDHYLLGTPSEIVAKIRARAEITNGIEHCILGPLNYDMSQLDLISKEIIPALVRR